MTVSSLAARPGFCRSLAQEVMLHLVLLLLLSAVCMGLPVHGHQPPF